MTDFTTKLSSTKGAVSLQNATVLVDDIPLIADIDFTLVPGSVTGLIGPNGAGKSTLLKVLARQQALSSGTLLVADRPSRSYGSRQFAQQVAYLPQTFPPAPGMTVDELVCLGRFPWHGSLGQFSSRDRDAVEEALSITGTEKYSARLTDSLSGGERQRCWIAMLLAQEASVLLLDEPVSALDARHQAETMALVRRIAQAKAISILVVLHDVNLAARYCHRITAMNSGQIVWEGSADQLMDAGILERIYETPMTVLTEPETRDSFAFATPSPIEKQA